MPRSNKKKVLSKPPQKHPPGQSTSRSTDEISYLLSQETKKMIAGAIASARKHGIQVEHGSSNPGTGDCAFQAAVQNINDRTCFQEKYPLSINTYRSNWVTDMANRTIDSPWNTLSRQDWLEGWRQMLTPGTYERGIFGDLMLPGIACGVRKILLIFNTNTDSPHDPIYVVNPLQFDVRADTDIPIILAYNMAHYESLHPRSEADIQESIHLVKSYEEGRYQFGRQDLASLISPDAEEKSKAEQRSYRSQYIQQRTIHIDKRETNHPQAAHSMSTTDEDSKCKGMRNVRELPTEELENINLVDIDNYLDSNGSKQNENKTANRKSSQINQQTSTNNETGKTQKKRTSKGGNGEMPVKEKLSREDIFAAPPKKSLKPNEEITLAGEDDDFREEPKKKTDKKTSEMNIQQNREDITRGKLCYRLRKKNEIFPIKDVNGRMECPICKKNFKNVKIHFERVKQCGQSIDISHFLQIYEEYRKESDKERIRIKNENYQKKQREIDPDAFKQKANEADQKYKKKQKALNPDDFKQKANEADQKYKKKQKDINPDSFKQKANVALQKY
jgi:hypothetical protein